MAINQTLADLIAIANQHAQVRFGVREAKLAALIASEGADFGQNPVYPELAVVNLDAGPNDEVALPESGFLSLFGQGGKGGGTSILSGIEPGEAGRLLIVFNDGPNDIFIDSASGSPASGYEIYGAGATVNVLDSNTDIAVQDDSVLPSGAMIALIYSPSWGGWTAITPVLTTGTVSIAELTQATSDIATAQTTLTTDSTSTGTVLSLALPAGGAVVFTNATAPTIQGIVAPAVEGRQLTIINGSAASNLTLNHLDGAAAATQQISSPGMTLDLSDQTTAAANGVLLPGQAITLIYAAAKWRAVSPIPSLIP